jgi:phage baseplate assembly protein W
MPYKGLVITPTQYNPGFTVQDSQFYRGFSTVDPTATDVKLYDYSLIKQDILNQFQVRQGERVMMPNFGTVIWDLLYEPYTDSTKSKIAADVQRICTGDPRAACNEINIVEQEYGMLLEITMTYSGANQTEKLILNFDKEIGLSVTQG